MAAATIVQNLCTGKRPRNFDASGKIVLPVNAKTSTIQGTSGARIRQGDVAKMVQKKTQDPTAQRLKQLRKAMGYTEAAKFARFLGVSKARWSNYENGYPLPREMIFLLCENINWLTSDWLYFGRTGGLPSDRVAELAGEPNGPATKRRKRRL
jgi:transcriptional regulator with XRE-family HTH domain